MVGYTIIKHDPIAIYGGGIIGLSIARQLIEASYNVCAIFDRNPDGVTNAPVNVMHSHDYINKNVIVFVTLMNGIEHTRVAQKLKNEGFEKIFFLPLFLQSAAAKSMIQVWNAFLCGKYDVFIPSYNSLWAVSSSDFILHEDESGFVVAIVHKNHVYSGKNAASDNAFSHYRVLIGSLLQVCDKPIDDIIFKEKFLSGLPFKDELTNYLHDTLFFNANDFFLSCAAPSELNEKGYFNLLDGHHRCFFLVDKGFKGIPLRILKHEWELYFKEREAQALMDYCMNLDSLPIPVKHPAFVFIPVKEREPDEDFLRLLRKVDSTCYGQMKPL